MKNILIGVTQLAVAFLLCSIVLFFAIYHDYGDSIPQIMLDEIPYFRVWLLVAAASIGQLYLIAQSNIANWRYYLCMIGGVATVPLSLLTVVDLQTLCVVIILFTFYVIYINGETARQIVLSTICKNTSG